MIILEGEFIARVTNYTRVKNMEETLQKGDGMESIIKHQNLLEVIKSRNKARIPDAVRSCYEKWYDLLDKEAWKPVNDVQ